MKKLVIILAILVGLVSGVSAEGLNIPTGYKELKINNTGISSYISNNNKIIIVDAPVTKFTLDMSHIGKYKGKNKWEHNIYKRGNIEDLAVVADNGNKNLYAAFNTQFFNNSVDNTPFSFPLKGAGKIFQHLDTETDLPKTTLYMYKGQLPIMAKGFSSKLFNHKNITDVITSLDPISDINVDKKFSADSKIGRFYIGCIPKRILKNNTAAICKNLLFFYSMKATHSDMLYAAHMWGISDNFLMAMDGSGSSQLYSNKISNINIEMYGTTKYLLPDYRDLPGVISLYSKWKLGTVQKSV